MAAIKQDLGCRLLDDTPFLNLQAHLFPGWLFSPFCYTHKYPTNFARIPVNMDINESNFCVVPFVQLNTRGKGDARVCCSISGLDMGIPKNLTIDEITEESYTRDTEVFNLANDPITELWNSRFMMDFRMKMLNGERISNCSFCYRMEESGLGSKRRGKNKKFLDRVYPLLETYYQNNGYVDVMPQWWEIRLSTKCNLNCIMCSPNLSSMIFKEYSKWGSRMTNQMQGSLAMAKVGGNEYLSESKFFKSQIIDNLKNILYMEFRGGEVFADKHSIDFIREIANTEHAKNITLDISTNATLIDDDIVYLLNRFKGGLLKFSIDAYKEKDELIRYHTKWEHVTKSLDISDGLHGEWKMVTQTCIQNANCIGIIDLLQFLDDYCKITNNTRFHLGFTTVRGKEWLRHELVPLSKRNEEIALLEEFIKTSWLCTKGPNGARETAAVLGLIKALRNEEIVDENLRTSAKKYYDKLSELRGIDYWKAFPHLEFLK